MSALKAPFPYFGGKRSIAAEVWQQLGHPKQYLEPFAGSAAMLLAAPKPASLEVINDLSHNIANFWRAVKYQPDAVIEAMQYPVLHIEMAARHAWLTEPERVAALRDALLDAEWPGDARHAAWWCWGQCAWIGSGWCSGKTTHWDQVAHTGNAGMGFQAPGKIASAGDAGRGFQAPGQIAHTGNAGMGDVWPRAREWIARLSQRLARVRVQAGTWDRALNYQYGGAATAVFLDPPYRSYTKLYAESECVADAVCEWAREHADLRIALCGHVGDYDLPGWEVLQWERSRNTYGSDKTKAEEAIWFSPACLGTRQGMLW